MVACRACLETNKEMRSLDEPFAIQYNLLTELKISVGDKMSQDICFDCWNTVNYFMNFRNRCITSESVMKNALLNIVKDDPDDTINSKIFLNTEVKVEAIDSEVSDNIHDDDNVETKITLDIASLATTNVSKDVVNESMRILRKRKMKEPVVIENAVKRKRYIKKKNVKMKRPLRNKVMKRTKNVNPKIQQKLKIKETAAVKLKQQLKIKGTAVKLKQNLKIEEAAVMKTKQHCGICIESFDDKKELFFHLEGHKNDTMCKLCDEQFEEWPEMLGHRLKHTPEKKTSCHLCDKYCMRPTYMEHHYRNTHYDGSVHLKCNQCERSFGTPQNLRKHKWSVHSKKQFTCDNCGESFNTKSKIRIHVLKHSNHKSLVCKLCDYSTKYISCLRSHIIGKHTESKVYCNDCGVLFPCQEKLDQHHCKQNSKVCPICGMKMLKSIRTLITSVVSSFENTSRREAVQMR
ncbi:PREDICTED: zinc finger protein 652 isoform X2 [Papilio polytes]|uniref:zinc finger protein 652 isoform X2 n=1 Tax=Papilio polytes TaxID=76194 RepID=UPI0006769DF2|nr:PREDICTED: zinc finger protein 652 isoform X2 [Papilio polytes]